MMTRLIVTGSLLLAACTGVVSQGPEGEQGPEGPVGSRGPAGPQGPAGVAGPLVVREAGATIEPGAYGRAEARCEEDEQPVAGGCRWGKVPGVLPHEGGPLEEWSDEDADAPELGGWVCSGISEGDETTEVVAFVVCAG